MVPFQTRVSVQIPNNGNTAQVKVTTVPNKRRLVIEYVSCDIQLPTGQRPFVFIATNVLGSGALIHRLFAEFQATFGPGDFFVGGHSPLFTLSAVGGSVAASLFPYSESLQSLRTERSISHEYGNS